MPATFTPQGTLDWLLQGLLSELIFGILALGTLTFLVRYAWSWVRAVWIYRVISIHNNETRTRRKGIHARDRFMDIVETKQPLASRHTAYSTGFIEGVFSENYLDSGILKLHKLVSLTDGNAAKVQFHKTPESAKVYWLAKTFEALEERDTVKFVLDRSGKQRQQPDRS